VANLVVTGICNLSCAFCFAPAQSLLPGGRREKAFISLETFEERLQFLDRSGIGEVRLIGGEPSLHPQFPELIRLARAHGKRLLVFTNGLLSEPALACLETLPPEECTVLVNMSAARASQNLSTAEDSRRREVMRRMGQRALPGVNLYRADFQLDGLFEVIQATGCRKAIRLGLAQPVLSGENEYLHPKQYRAAGRKIARLASQAGQAGIRLEFDCGFVRCMFSESDLERLRQAGTKMEWRCNPILDIGLDGSAVHCFPLGSMMSAPLSGETTAGQLRQAMEQFRRPYRMAGVFPDCSGCLYKGRNECAGGCLANTIRRFRHTHNRVIVPAGAVSGELRSQE
jgi:hypothetical protein